MVNASCVDDSLRLLRLWVLSPVDTSGLSATVFSACCGIHQGSRRELSRNLVWICLCAAVQWDRFDVLVV